MKILHVPLLMLASSLGILSFYSRQDDLVVIKNVVRLPEDTVKKPVVTLEEDSISSMTILVIKDTAATIADISPILGKGYAELFDFAGKNELKTGKVMAFYHSWQFPIIMEVAVEVDRFPYQTAGRIKINRTGGGNAVIAHYRGPYDGIGIAYTAIAGWLKDKNKMAAGTAFEVYLDDPLSVKDPFYLRTDLYQLFR